MNRAAGAAKCLRMSKAGMALGVNQGERAGDAPCFRDLAQGSAAGSLGGTPGVRCGILSAGRGAKCRSCRPSCAAAACGDRAACRHGERARRGAGKADARFDAQGVVARRAGAPVGSDSAENEGGAARLFAGFAASQRRDDRGAH